MAKSKFITKELLQTILNQFKEEWLNRYLTPDKKTVAVIVVLDPSIPTGFIDCDPPVLWTGIIGEQDHEKWPTNRHYYEFAYAKARAAWRTGMSNNEMFMNPELIVTGDFKYEGGIYTAGGLVIAVSGLAKATNDTMLANEFARHVHDTVFKLFEASKTEVNGEVESSFYF